MNPPARHAYSRGADASLPSIRLTNPTSGLIPLASSALARSATSAAHVSPKRLLGWHPQTLPYPRLIPRSTRFWTSTNTLSPGAPCGVPTEPSPSRTTVTTPRAMGGTGTPWLLSSTRYGDGPAPAGRGQYARLATQPAALAARMCSMRGMRPVPLVSTGGLCVCHAPHRGLRCSIVYVRRTRHCRLWIWMG